MKRSPPSQAWNWRTPEPRCISHFSCNPSSVTEQSSGRRVRAGIFSLRRRNELPFSYGQEKEMSSIEPITEEDQTRAVFEALLTRGFYRGVREIDENRGRLWRGNPILSKLQSSRLLSPLLGFKLVQDQWCNADASSLFRLHHHWQKREREEKKPFHVIPPPCKKISKILS